MVGFTYRTAKILVWFKFSGSCLLTSCRILILVCANSLTFQNHFWVCSWLLQHYWRAPSLTTLQLFRCFTSICKGPITLTIHKICLWREWLQCQLDWWFHLPFWNRVSGNIFQKHRLIIFNSCCLSSHTVLMWYLDSTD